MRDQFYTTVDQLIQKLHKEEILLASYHGGTSDFSRINRSAVRQAGCVEQRIIELELINGQRHLSTEVTLSGQFAPDMDLLHDELKRLRDDLSLMPEDPYLSFANTPHSTEKIESNDLPPIDEALDTILKSGIGKDLVGIYVAGTIRRGFANSLGQRNWFESHSFNWDWTFYRAGDQAVKGTYAGFKWDPAEFDRKLREAENGLSILGRKQITIKPGDYRVYLAPSALKEILGMLSWGGFSIKAQRTGGSPLLRLVSGEASLHPDVSIQENSTMSLAPQFSSAGFIKPDSVPLIENGQLRQSLVSPRSAKEYGIKTTGGGEFPESLEMAGGSLETARLLETLDEGLYVNSLWYLNYPDRTQGRLTGMTRFATFWVENGKLAAPLSVMRFDDTIYRMLGSELAGLTRDTDFFPVRTLISPAPHPASELPEH